ncbi:hypothetical protein [Umezawaea tangerina]|uniref:Uncharacterized protein n=1 Tax=Umezawaea tangerina TaxID=84725 RepID=A0A2T0TGR9_9PSEU|nr:hypothetical protein [Umezawaea tangerina]PRY44884.1 hypothetical protein CLV43_102449 [Umezawaea tangerina]
MTDDDWPRHARSRFLAELWRLVVDEDDEVDGTPAWVESWSRGTPPGAVPEHPTAAALHRILARGVDPDDLTDVVRAMQHEVVGNVCLLLDDPALLGVAPDEDRAGIGWELTAVRSAPPDRRPMGDLHAAVDEHDPTGRAGEPRGRPVPARLPGQPPHARTAVAQARAGDRLGAIRTWRAATGTTAVEAKAALDALLDDAEARHRPRRP